MLFGQIRWLGSLFLPKYAHVGVSKKMLITSARINQIEISLLFLLEDELFMQICLNQWWIENITDLFFCVFSLFFCVFSTASVTILNFFTIFELLLQLLWRCLELFLIFYLTIFFLGFWKYMFDDLYFLLFCRYWEVFHTLYIFKKKSVGNLRVSLLNSVG